MIAHDTTLHPCETCARSTEHVRRQKRDPRRSHEPAAPAREVLVCVECATWSETLPSAAKFKN